MKYLFNVSLINDILQWKNGWKAAYLIIGFSFICAQGSAQQMLTEKDILFNISHLNNLGKELLITKIDTTLLAPGKYQYNYTKRNNKHLISFVINDAGKPDGVVDVDSNFKTFVTNGMMYRYEDYDEDIFRLRSESYMRGDTIVWKAYNKFNQLSVESWRINERTVYDFNCDCDITTDSIKSCTLTDEVNGFYIQYVAGGKIASKVITKNLPKGVITRSEEYDEKGKQILVWLKYEDETSKTTYANGEYMINKPTDEGHHIKKFTKKGKLIEDYILPYPTAN